MEEENNKKTFKIWLYLIPLFILAAWPALRWLHKANSGELNLSKDEATAFNSENGEIRKTIAPTAGKPDFDYGILGVRYKSKGGATANANAEAEEEAARQAAAQKQAAAAKQTAAAGPNNAGRNGAAASGVDGMKAKEQQSVGYSKGYLSYAMGKVINSPKAVSAILNNKNVISGFMARGAVKDATASPEALAAYLKSGGPANFINNPLVKAAMSNPGVVSAVASSGLVSAMLDTPAGKALMNDPQAVANLVASNPELVGVIMSNPNTMNLMSNPDVTNLTGKFDTSGIKTR
jgi:hypothetical protein